MDEMSPEQLKICIEITEKLRKMPAALFFNEPVDKVPGYYKKIKNPQDLGTIYGRLTRGEYKSVANWEKDIETVWSNAGTYNGKDSYIFMLAEHMAKEFRRLKKPLELFTVAGWSKSIYTLREKFDQILALCPPSLQSIVPRNLDNLLPTMQNFNSKEISNFIKASEMCQTPKEIEQVVAILKKNDPPILSNEDDLIIDINSLSSSTLHEIRAFYRKELIEQGLPYPNEENEYSI